MTASTADMIYEMIRSTDMILNHCLAAFFLGYLCSRLLGRKNGRHDSQIRWYLPAAVYFAVMSGLYFMPFVLSSFLAYLLGAAAAYLVMAFVCRGDKFWSLFLAVTFFSLRWQGMSVTSSVSIELFDFAAKFLNWLTEGRFALAWQWNMVHIGVNSLLNVFLDALILTLFAKWLSAKFLSFDRKLCGKEKLFLITPGVSGSVGYFVIHWIIEKYDLADDKGIFREYPYFSGIVTCMNLLLMLSTLVVLSLFTELEKKREEEKTQAVQQSQIQELRGHVQQMEQVYSSIQGMKHDVKNHIAVMEELIAQKRFQEAKAYLEPMSRAVEILDYVYKTGNPVTDVIIQEKYKRADAEKLIFHSEFQFPMQSNIDVFDISVILNNALENALEAASKAEQGCILVSSEWQKQTFLMEVVNSFDGELEFDKESGLLLTTKPERANHGMGLKNIQRVAEKYCGTLDIEVREKEFVLTVLLSAACDLQSKS